MSVTFLLQNDLRFGGPLRHYMKSVILGYDFFHKLSETAFVLGLGKVSRVVGYPNISRVSELKFGFRYPRTLHYMYVHLLIELANGEFEVRNWR